MISRTWRPGDREDSPLHWWLFYPISICLLAIAGTLAAQVTGPISIHAPCTQTLNTVVGAYSGNLAITAWQFGFISVNVVTGSQANIQFKNGVWKPMLGGCSGQSNLSFVGDCWQSVIQLTATKGSPKWLITPGAPTLCDMDGLMVWKWNTTTSRFDVVGLAPPPAMEETFRLGMAVLDGDTAWSPLTHNKWTPCDLNTMVCGPAVGAHPPGEGRQQNVGGFAYNVGVDYTHPPENGGPVWFWMTRADQPTPTRPPFGTPTKTPTGPTPTRTITPSPGVTPTPSAGSPFAAYISWAANNGITAGCGGGNFCPTNPVTREQMTAFLWNLYHLEHPGSILPLCQQQFNDVVCK